MADHPVRPEQAPPRQDTPRHAESQHAVARLDRHPNDGWVRADPWPMGPNLLRAFRALVTALCPPAEEGAPTSPGLLDAVVLQIRSGLPYMHPLTARGVVLIVVLLDWSPLWRFRGLRRLHRVPSDVAAQQLDTLAGSRLFGKLVVAARAAVLTAYFDQPEVHAAIGYTPVAFMKTRIAARDRLRAGVDPTADLLSPDEATLTAGRIAANGARS